MAENNNNTDRSGQPSIRSSRSPTLGPPSTYGSTVHRGSTMLQPGSQATRRRSSGYSCGLYPRFSEAGSHHVVSLPGAEKVSQKPSTIKETFLQASVTDQRRMSMRRPLIPKPFGEGKGIIFKSELHSVIFKYTESRFFSGFIMGIIFLNTTMLIGQTWPVVNVRAAWYLAFFDNIFLGIYVMEVVVKLYVWRKSFFHEGWNILDFVIVLFNVIDFSLPLILQNVGGFNGAAIFRLLRIFRAVKAIRALRVLRTIRFLNTLQVIMTTLLQSIKSIGAIVSLITLTMYMFAVIGRGLYADVDVARFGSLFDALFTLFQLLTLDDWYEIYEHISEKGRWHIILYLMLYIVVEYFIFLNLFVAVLVDNFQLSLEAANDAAKKRKLAKEELCSDDEDETLADEGDDDDETSEGSISTHASDVNKVQKTMDELYPGLPDEDQQTLRDYFRIMASMEYNHMILNKQHRILNMMTDICADTNDDL